MAKRRSYMVATISLVVFALSPAIAADMASTPAPYVTPKPAAVTTTT
jgi:hypothetical protein